MRPSNLIKSLVLSVAIAVGLFVPSPTGPAREVQLDLVKSLTVSPVNVAPLGLSG